MSIKLDSEVTITITESSITELDNAERETVTESPEELLPEEDSALEMTEILNSVFENGNTF